ncbi:MAG: hypothetical protein Kow0063_02670 [Anaerolineae bacterium]
MTGNQVQRGRTIPILLTLWILVAAGAGCNFGPYHLVTSTPPGNDDLALTVTAVLATNTQIAAWRTGTAQASVAVSTSTPTPAPLLPIDSPTPAQPMAATITPLPTEAPSVAEGEVLLVYTQSALTLYNTAGRPIDISGLSFHSEAGELLASQWDNGFLTAPLYAFPPGDCLMVWSLDTPQQPRPPDCNTRHAWIAVNAVQAFWRFAGGFEVRSYGQPLARCPGTSGRCVISLP